MVALPEVRVLQSLPRSVRMTEPPLQLRPGQVVTVGERSDEWPAFVLVRTSRGECAWVPERCLGSERPRTRARRAYDTRVVDPRIGETLGVLVRDERSGWLWCRDADGAEGWYPISHVEPL